MINPAIEEDLKRMSLNDVNYADYIKENYIQIPDNATNGDMIKAMFPNWRIKYVRKMSGLNRYDIEIDELNRLSFYEDWWNSPYKEDKENKE
jgi:hypothetical protein